MKNLSICIIAKNEEKNIGQCISAINSSINPDQIQYEVCLTDTGSTDDTINIATSLGANVHNYVWQNDFSAARNFAMSVAKYDHILFVDSDEMLEKSDWTTTMTLLDNYPKYVGMITRRNLCNSGKTTAITVDKVARLFDRRLYHYELSIHEQLVANDNSQLSVYDIPLTFYHEGYVGTIEALTAKAKRNNDLLFKELEKTPNDPYIYFQIAQSYGLLNDKVNQYAYCQKAYNLCPDIRDVYTTDLILSLGYNYLNNLEYTKAIDLYNKHYNDLSHLADYLCLGALAHIKADKLIEAIDICFAALKTTDYSIEGSNSDIPSYYLGCIYDSFGNISLAKKYYQLANHYTDSDNKLESINNRGNLFSACKKISIIIPSISIDDINSFMNNLLKQTMDINDLELIFIGDLSKISGLADYEASYPDSIMLINIEENLSTDELINIAISYASGEYIYINSSVDYGYIDGLRHIYTASHNEKCDVGTYSITYGNEKDYYITVNSISEADTIKKANILLSGTYNKIFSRDLITKNNLDYAKLFNNSFIDFSKKIYCCHEKLI